MILQALGDFYQCGSNSRLVEFYDSLNVIAEDFWQKKTHGSDSPIKLNLERMITSALYRC